MRLILSIIAGAVVLASAPDARAQGKKAAPKKAQVEIGPERCLSEDGKIECRIFRRADFDSLLMKRAAIGVQLSPTGTARDTIGVFVSRVTPKGPAENAGIVEGDRIVSINGIDLRVNAADAGDSYAAGLPTRRLTREVEKLSPGATINLRVWSGGRHRDVQVTAGRASDLRERTGLGMFFDGMPGGMIMGDMPHAQIHTFPRTQIRAFPRTRIQSFPKIRMESFPRMYIDGFENYFDYEKKEKEKEQKEKKS